MPESSSGFLPIVSSAAFIFEPATPASISIPVFSLPIYVAFPLEPENSGETASFILPPHTFIFIIINVFVIFANTIFKNKHF